MTVEPEEFREGLRKCIDDMIKSILKGMRKEPVYSRESTFKQMGFDEYDFADFVICIEDRYKVEMPLEYMSDYPFKSIKDTEDYMADFVGARTGIGK